MPVKYLNNNGKYLASAHCEAIDVLIKSCVNIIKSKYYKLLEQKNQLLYLYSNIFNAI